MTSLKSKPRPLPQVSKFPLWMKIVIPLIIGIVVVIGVVLGVLFGLHVLPPSNSSNSLSISSRSSTGTISTVSSSSSSSSNVISVSSSQTIVPQDVNIVWGFNTVVPSVITLPFDGTLMFNFTTNAHNLNLFTSVEAYNTCDFTSSTFISSTGPTTISMLDYGPSNQTIYFGCSIGTHCTLHNVKQSVFIVLGGPSSSSSSSSSTSISSSLLSSSMTSSSVAKSYAGVMSSNFQPSVLGPSVWVVNMIASFAVGDTVKVAWLDDTNDFMIGTITAIDTVTPSITVNAESISGPLFTNWSPWTFTYISGP